MRAESKCHSDDLGANGYAEARRPPWLLEAKLGKQRIDRGDQVDVFLLVGEMVVP